jgi:uncharacterized protein (DUF1330 family)
MRTLCLLLHAALTTLAISGTPALAEPPAYIVGSITITDFEAYNRVYGSKVPALIEAHGGRYLVRGGKMEPLEGAATRPRHVIVVFPDMAAARGFWNSPEYLALAAARQPYASFDLVLVEGRPAD